MIAEFELPEELGGATYEKILAKMKGLIPAVYDATEGGFIHDMLAPSALEAEELIQFWLTLALQTCYHMFASGRWLDYHAADCGLVRRPATYATGSLVIETSEEVTIPEGFLFCIPGENGIAAQDFIATEGVSGAGTLEVRVQAAAVGTVGNVKQDTIIAMKTPLRGIVSITNPERLTGGVAAESDESLRKRIDDFYAGRGASFVGNCKDYRRWALEVAGVGFVHVIPCAMGANTVKIVLADANGDPATEELCQKVERFIFGKSHDDLERLAPIGLVQWEVVPAQLLPVNFSVELKLAENYSSAQAAENIRANLLSLYKSLADEENYYGELKYTAVADAIYHAAGVEDYRNLRINGGTDNVSFGADFIPATGDLELDTYD